MKYTVICAIIIGLYWIWQFVSAVMERGFPAHPTYYVSAVVGAIVGYLSFKLMREKVTKRRFRLIPIFILVIAIAFNVSGVKILQYIGSGLFYWYFLIVIGFSGYYSIRRWSPEEGLTDVEKRIESLNKILVFILPFMIILMVFSEI